MALVNNYRASSVVSNGWSIERVLNGVKGFLRAMSVGPCIGRPFVNWKRFQHGIWRIWVFTGR